MKRIGVISDTHLSESGRRGLPERVVDYFRGVDLIIHAGDFTSRRAMRDLERIAPVVGVRGNNDPAHLELPRARRVEVEGVTIGLCHGDRGRDNEFFKPLDQFPGNAMTAANALSQFEWEDDVSVLIFGHSHNPMVMWHRHEQRALLFFNPGSPTDKRFGPKYACGMLHVDGDSFTPQLWTW
jgi:putative phosphoesterase